MVTRERVKANSSWTIKERNDMRRKINLMSSRQSRIRREWHTLDMRINYLRKKLLYHKYEPLGVTK